VIDQWKRRATCIDWQRGEGTYLAIGDEDGNVAILNASKLTKSHRYDAKNMSVCNVSCATASTCSTSMSSEGLSPTWSDRKLVKKLEGEDAPQIEEFHCMAHENTITNDPLIPTQVSSENNRITQEFSSDWPLKDNLETFNDASSECNDVSSAFTTFPQNELSSQYFRKTWPSDNGNRTFDKYDLNDPFDQFYLAKSDVIKHNEGNQKIQVNEESCNIPSDDFKNGWPFNIQNISLEENHHKEITESETAFFQPFNDVENSDNSNEDFTSGWSNEVR